MKKLLTSVLMSLGSLVVFAQTIPFEYEVTIVPKTVPNFPGVHSFAFAEANGKWVIIGGRRDGLHARQPNSSFPAASNNADIFVIDPVTAQFWSAPLSTLTVGISEQLQTTNLNFYQDGDTLYLLGGYAYSATALDHITFPNLTSVQVSGLIEAIVNNNPIAPYFKQITDQNFAVSGGQLGKIGDTYYLVGGNRFDGRYNPMGNATYVQTYVDGIRKFKLDNSGSQLSYNNYSVITDQVHLHRRDYNLVPQIFPNGEEGYMISSGVFQIGIDLPFLYPVEIKSSGHTPVTTFNQYLSNYHSPKVGMYDASSNSMHSLFFGGMSQYYYNNGTLIQDDAVPFVKTISRVSRDANGVLQEVVLSNEMPAFLGASAEFIPNLSVPRASNGVVLLSQITQDSVLVGYVVGGISSPELNPFAANNTGVTSAHNGIYEVWIKKNEVSGWAEIDGTNPVHVQVSPNPVVDKINITFQTPEDGMMYIYITDNAGRIVWKNRFHTGDGHQIELNTKELALVEGTYYFNFSFEGRYSAIEKVIILKD
jgi:hypothetical protein